MKSGFLWERSPDRDASNRVPEHSPTAGALSHKCEKVKIMQSCIYDKDNESF
jgi:hypothetical protein